jgi:hypothetical protein
MIGSMRVIVSDSREPSFTKKERADREREGRERGEREREKEGKIEINPFCHIFSRGHADSHHPTMSKTNYQPYAPQTNYKPRSDDHPGVPTTGPNPTFYNNASPTAPHPSISYVLHAHPTIPARAQQGHAF